MSTRLALYARLLPQLWRSARWQIFKSGVRVEQPCFVGAGCTVRTAAGGTISMRRTQLCERVHLHSEGRLVIEPGVFVNRDSMIVAMGSIRIGAGTHISERVSIRDHDHRFSDTGRRIAEQGYEIAPINIGEDCWIGCNAVVLKGVSIGRHTVVGASSVVTQDLPPFCVAAGVPARILRTLPAPASVAHGTS